MIALVISGGQTGVDQAGLRAAKAVGIRTGGVAPRGFRVDGGEAPWLADYGLTAHPSRDYPPRTRANVASSDGTIILGDPSSAGCRITRRYAAELSKPLLIVWKYGAEARSDDASARMIVEFLTKVRNPTVVNIAGNRERTNPGIGAWAEAVLTRAFEEIQQGMK